MATRRTRKSKSDIEDLSDANLLKAYKKLYPATEDVKPWTKKDVCALLGMNYNTARLDKLLSDFIEKRKDTIRRRKERRGKPVTENEAAYIISEYLDGLSKSQISKTSYRSMAIINKILEDYEVPERPSKQSYWDPPLLPEQGDVKFSKGDLVYSARYGCVAEIHAGPMQHKTEGEYYRIWVLGDRCRYSYQPRYDLASLDKLTKLGVQIST